MSGSDRRRRLANCPDRSKGEGGWSTCGFLLFKRETADTLLTDLAVAYGATRIDARPARHMEHVEKYNRLLRIREKLEKKLT